MKKSWAPDAVTVVLSAKLLFGGCLPIKATAPPMTTEQTNGLHLQVSNLCLCTVDKQSRCLIVRGCAADVAQLQFQSIDYNMGSILPTCYLFLT